MRWFFYGTLMDADILDIVLGRTVDRTVFAPAWVQDYQRYGVRGEHYPVLRPTPGARVYGLLGRLDGPRDAARLAWYEGPGFRRVALPVKAGAGETLTAYVFMDRGAHKSARQIWDHEAWRTSRARTAMIGQAHRHRRAGR